ncbi:NVEALA domain-containing protein [Viscerimonas tarda]
MKKKIFGSLAILAIAAVTVLNVNLGSQSNKMGDIMLANIEALADFEFNNQNWTDSEQWYNDLDMNGVSDLDWRPDLNNCIKTTQTFNGQAYIFWGYQISCVSGYGNCFDGTGCI